MGVKTPAAWILTGDFTAIGRAVADAAGPRQRFSTGICGNVIDIAHSTVLTRLDHKTKVKW
jgi:hypothetical protein